MARHYDKGKFVPQNPQKYVGDVNNIVWRSSWEKQFLRWCDVNPSVLKYSSEEVVIPYIHPMDNKPHRYFPDMMLELQKRDGTVEKVMVEIKPSKECVPPAPTKNKKTLTEATITYMINQAKWKAAQAFCQKHGMRFVVLTEKELFKNAKH